MAVSETRTTWPDDLDDLERALLENLGRLAGGTVAAPGIPLAPGSSLTAAALDRAVRRPAGESPPRPRRPLAARPGSRLLHDRLGRPRVQRPRRRRPAPHRPGPAALPLRRVLPRPGPAGARPRRRARRPARAARRRRRADRRRSAQGVRPPRVWRSSRRRRRSRSHLPRALGVAFAIGRAARLGLATRWPHRRDRGVQLRRRLAQPLDRRRAPSTRPPTPSHQRMRLAAAVRLRGQRARASACPRRRAGSRRRCRAGRSCATSRSTAPTRSAVYDAAEELADHVRGTAPPAILHLRTVRFGGHAGTDVESAYRTAASVRADAGADPIARHRGRLLVDAGARDAGRARRALPRLRAPPCGRPRSSSPARRSARWRRPRR